MQIQSLLRSFFSIFILSTALSGCSQQPSGSEQGQPAEAQDPNQVMFDSTRWIGGLQTDALDRQQWVKDLQSVGMNTVEVTTYAKQGAWNSDELSFPEPDSATLKEIRTAKELGMKVVLILRVEVDKTHPDNDFIWHGMIFPASEEALGSWFSKYQRFTNQWAEVAEQEGVDMLVLGSELNALFATQPVEEVPNLEAYFLNRELRKKFEQSFFDSRGHVPPEYLEELSLPGYENFDSCLVAEGRKQELWARTASFMDANDRVEAINRRRELLKQNWKSLIDNNRKIYTGKVSLAANFDNYKHIDFWPDMDCLSINAYFPLRMLDTGGEKTMVESWTKVFGEINEFRGEAGIADRPVFFTELGYSPYSGTALAPWSASSFSWVEDSLFFWKAQVQDPSERITAVSSLAKAVKQENFPLQGVLYWKFATQEFTIEEEPYALELKENQPDEVMKILSKLKD